MTDQEKIRQLLTAIEPFARFFKSEGHDFSPASGTTPVAMFQGQNGEILAELWMADFRRAYDAYRKFGAN